MYNSYLISLRKETIRRKHAIEQMENMFGIKGFEIINAFDARDFYKVSGSNGDFKWWLDSDSFEAIRVSKEFNMPLNRIIPPDFTKTEKWLHKNPGSPGCTLSHGYTWKKFLETKGDVVFIAEDDIHFVDDVGFELDRIAEFTVSQKEPTVVSTYYFEQARIELKRSSELNLGGVNLYIPINPKVVFSSVGIFLNRSAVESLYSKLIPVSFLPDWFGKFQERGWIKNFWVANPFLSKPSGEPTTIATHYSGDYQKHSSLIRHGLHLGAEAAVKLNAPVLKPYVINRRNKLYVQGGTYFVD